MSESIRRATGRKVVSRASARELGVVDHVLVDAEQRRITAVVVGRGRRARLVDWTEVSGFGPDAVMVHDEGALRLPADNRERAAVDGSLDLVGRRTLTERGNELGSLDDVTFDPESGVLETLRIGDREIPADSLLGSGPYAVVLEAGQEPVP